MKYWLFDGNDIIGPFAPHELAGRKGFSPMSLVCPDGYSDRADHWQMASTFEELKPALNGEETAPAKTWEKEVDTLIKQEPAIEVDDTPTSPGSSLQVPKTPAKAGPIEEYFNTIRGEDLGNILGIPDPNENTDADLARVIENELGPALAPTDKEEYEPLRTPAQPAAAKPQAQKTISKAPQKQSKPAAQQPQPRKHPAQKKPAPKPQQVTREPDSPEGIRIIDLDEQKPAVLKTTPAPAPAKKAPVKKAAQGGPSKTITKNEVEIEKFDTGRIQEEVSSYKETPAETQTPAELPIRRRPARSQWLMALLACLLLFVLGRLLTQEENYVEEVTGSFKASAAEIFSRFTAAPTPPLPSGTTAVSAGEPAVLSAGQLPVSAGVTPAAVNEESDLRSPYAEPEADDAGAVSEQDLQPLTPPKVALNAVQNYELPNGKGTVATYFEQYYAPQFAKGYEADWSVALLHKDIYVVQYRLTKTRTEPIVYVFEADGAKGILTGALNNITLDLVGKIQQ